MYMYVEVCSSIKRIAKQASQQILINKIEREGLFNEDKKVDVLMSVINWSLWCKYSQVNKQGYNFFFKGISFLRGPYEGWVVVCYTAYQPFSDHSMPN